MKQKQEKRLPLDGNDLASRRLIRSILFLVVVAISAALVFYEPLMQAILKFLFPNAVQYVYERASLGELLLEHVVIVVISSLAATIVGVLLGIAVTRQSGREFLPLVRNISSLAQTFPPVAILALVAPIVGFGFKPAIIALFIFSILPVVNNTIAGMEAIPRELTEASRGIGMTNMQVLLLSELPLSARVIAAGVRTSIVINIGTATVGAVIGAGGLGVIIIAGLVRTNPAFTFSGAIVVALLALMVDWGMGRLESLFFSFRERTTA